ncbi:unnamed protein product [Paramecium primaurelia]|uniref:Uncharacterized protein n=1 Tax=Paramecium primaurelia TaxID=5886 RepID=A0A8S1P8B0_PARPR|nr:unnamed protein product [Paramecium primaurelia]
MSGLFKNYSKFVSASVFASANKLIINPARWTFNSANLFYNPSYRYTGLPQGHELTAFSLAQIASALTYEAQQFNTVDTLKDEAQLNQQFSAQCVREAIKFIKNNNWNQEVETSAQLLYVIQNNGLLKDVNKEILLSNLSQNAKYLSTQNIVDVVISLQDHKDAGFWSQFFNGIKNKEFSWELQPIDYHGWDTMQFDYLDQVKNSFKLSNTWAVLTAQDSQLKRFVLEGVLFGYTNLWLPLLYREKRIKYVFDDRLIDRSAFKNALKKINEVHNVQEFLARA